MADNKQHFAPGMATPYLVIKDADKAIAFYKKVFGAVENMRMNMPDGKIMHADISVGSSRFMMTEENLQCNNKAPQTLGGTSVSFYLYVADPDATYNLALKEGATVLRAIEDRFYGDRVGVFTDPFGHVWSVAKHIEDVAPDEIKRRAANLFTK